MPDNKPLLTVLLPVYNTELYIGEAIESILNQTFRDFEFLIIDDGSTDGTAAIIDAYKDERIRVVHQPNMGLINTLNKGIDISKGTLIARMDADDISFPERLELQMKFMNEHPEYVAIGAVADVVDKEGAYLLKLTPVGYSDEEIRERINLRVPFCHPMVVFRKQAAIDAGYYPKNAIDFEDHLLWKNMLNFGKLCNLHETLGLVRFNPESVTIDEKWRGKTFWEIRRRSVENGFVTDEDATTLRNLIASQNLKPFKQASYHSMVGKKYLWNNPNSKLAREHFRESIKYFPRYKEPYLLYAFSFIPAVLRVGIYKLLKKKGR